MTVVSIKGKAPRRAIATHKKPGTDWEAVERDYRTTNLTLRELGRLHHVSHAAISKKAEKLGWARDLTHAVKQATDSKLIDAAVKAAVTTTVNNAVTNAVAQSAAAAKSNTVAVMVVAELNKNVIIGHRTGLNKLTTIKNLLLDQIEQAAVHMVDLAKVIEMARSPDENGMDRANDALKKAMGRSVLVDDLKKLADVDEKIRKGEREAFNINDADKGQAQTVASRMTDAERAVRLMDMLQLQGNSR